MTTRSLCAPIALVISLAGCGSYHWERPMDRPQADYDRDRAECYLMARGMPKQGYTFAGGGSGQAGAYAAAGASFAAAGAALGQAIQEQEDREACFTMMGWKKVRDQQIPATTVTAAKGP